MELSNVGKKFVYVSIIMMLLSMILPWESLSDYTYSESMGLLMNIIPAVIFAISALMVILKPLAKPKKIKTVWENYSVANTYEKSEENEKVKIVKKFINENKFITMYLME